MFAQKKCTFGVIGIQVIDKSKGNYKAQKPIGSFSELKELEKLCIHGDRKSAI